MPKRRGTTVRILFAIPHFCDPSGDSRYSSMSPNTQGRLNAFTACISAIHQLFGKRHYLVDIAKMMARQVNQHQGHEVDIVVLTTGDKHLLDDVPVPKNLYRHVAVDLKDPLMLEFECHAILRDGMGRGYDYYCFQEDDLVHHDPLFFTKLQWFNRHAGEANLLHPRRYEVTFRGDVHKLYLDGAIRKELTARWQNLDDQPEIQAQVLDAPLRFVRPLNPHSGCFFLNANQMAYWTAQPYFLDRDTSFIGPLESAATLGMMRTFRIYKTAPENADFFQIQHFDVKHLKILGSRVKVAAADGDQPQA